MNVHRFRNALMFAGALVAGAGFAPPTFATDVGVSVAVSQPGFYGRIDIGNAPAPVLVYPQPVIVRPAPVAVVRQPIYLHVPPGHAKNWAKHCHRYSACGQPVYFVQDQWYQEVYAPRLRHAPRTEQHYMRERVIERERIIERGPRDSRPGHGHRGKARKGKGRD